MADQDRRNFYYPPPRNPFDACDANKNFASLKAPPNGMKGLPNVAFVNVGQRNREIILIDKKMAGNNKFKISVDAVNAVNLTIIYFREDRKVGF